MGNAIRKPRRAVLVAIGVALVLLAAPAWASAAPLVRIDDAHLSPSARGPVAAATATITWNRPAIDRLTMGEVRLLAVSARDQLPTELDSRSYAPLADKPVQPVRLEVRRADLDKIAPGNRVVLTATQHEYNPSSLDPTPESFVTVEQLRAGPSRGQIGRVDCSDRPIVANAFLRGCDLVGAYLENALVSEANGTKLETADLTGANLRGAQLTRATIAAGRVNGADATGARIDRVSLAHTDAARFEAPGTTIVDANFPDARFVDADFEGTTFQGSTPDQGTSLIHATLDGANMRKAQLLTSDMTTARFVGTDLRGARFVGGILYFANLTRANLIGAAFADPTALDWALLCDTKLPTGEVSDRDCTG